MIAASRGGKLVWIGNQLDPRHKSERPQGVGALQPF